jgi:DNA polymerase-3 subunit gamma/tau
MPRDAISSACWSICRRLSAALLDAIAQRRSQRSPGRHCPDGGANHPSARRLREGEGGVKLGLAERINFEVTLLKAVEASRARAIDSLIKELSALADESASSEADEKKKTG